MTTERAQKGRSLETAVKFIQEAILDADPKLKGSKFTIESNKWEAVSRVRHEIDVLVKTFPGSPYEATYIFECKNWEKPVGKNEVIVFAEKVEALRATCGFFVAKNLTSDAEAQLQLKPRLKFIRCATDFLSPLNAVELIHFVHDVLPPTTVIKFRDVPPESNPPELDPRNIICLWNNKPVDFSVFINTELRQITEKVGRENQTMLRNEGNHCINTIYARDFEPNEFFIDGKEVETITIPYFCFTTSRRRRIISKFELEGQGQVFAFEPIERDDAEKPLEIHIVTRF